MNGWWWLPIGIGGALAIRFSYEVYRDRRDYGEWIWQTWRRERQANR